jgi:Coenzyme PQQ synthesis protein D (PqqD)
MENPRKINTVSTVALGDGLGVFDPAQNKTYLLNPTSALVWQHCDGNTAPQELTALLVRKFNVAEAQAQQLTQLALDELTNFNLLEAEAERLRVVPQTGLSRRQVLATLAAVGISAVLLPIVSPVVAKADGEEELIPFLECVTDNGNGTFTAHFGYVNQTSHRIVVPLGPDNKFDPSPHDRGQPTIFDPGEHSEVFQVTFNGTDGKKIEWLLTAGEGECRHRAVASADSPRCPTTTTFPVTTTRAPTTTPAPPLPTTTPLPVLPTTTPAPLPTPPPITTAPPPTP